MIIQHEFVCRHCGAPFQNRDKRSKYCSHKCATSHNSGEDHSSYKHGGGGQRLYGIWRAMIARCHNPKGAGYAKYGELGIQVCAEWRDAFQQFREWALSSGYSERLVIDRANNDDGYSPSNCRWVTYGQNNLNKRNNHFITAFNETKTVTEWASDARCVVSYAVLANRLRRNRRSPNWSPETAITTPLLPRGKSITNIRHHRRPITSCLLSE